MPKWSRIARDWPMVWFATRRNGNGLEVASGYLKSTAELGTIKMCYISSTPSGDANMAVNENFVYHNKEEAERELFKVALQGNVSPGPGRIS